MCVIATRNLLSRAVQALPLLLAGWLLAGCSGPPQVTPPPPDAVSAPAEALPPRIGIDVFLDASLSMQGFATAEGSSTTAYAQALEYLDSSRLLLPNSDLEFYRFGAQLAPGAKPGQTGQPTLEQIPNRDFRQAFRKPFYADPRFRADNFLDQVVKKAPLRTLGVIVSDLFQADSDITQLSQSLQGRLSAGASVAVLAIESQFHGTVYDIGTQKLKLDYAGPRPCFALMYGQPAAVRAYGDALYGELKKGRVACHLLRLSPEIVAQPVSFARGTPQELVRLDSIDSLLPVADDRVVQMRLQPGGGTGVFPCEFPFEPAAAGMRFELSRIRSAVEVKRWEGGDWKDEPKAAEGVSVETTPPEPPAPADPSASPAAPDAPKPGLRAVFHFDPARLPAPGVFRVDCRLGLEAGDFRVPEWFEHADMDVSRISEWQRNPSLYHGEVLNLRRFIEEIWLNVCHQHPPALGQLYVYLEVPEP